jgi:hypothetical protein
MRPLLLAFAAVLAACSDPTPAASDAAPDTVDATAPDAAADVTSPDVARDGSVDAAPDASPDAVADVAQDGACARPDVMVLPDRIDCGRGGGTCPAGYECLSFSGIVLQQYCGRSCRSDCDCPVTQRCGSYTDKAGTHPLCVAM